MVSDVHAEITISQHPIIELPFLHTLALHCVAFMAPAISILLHRLSLPEIRNFTLLSSGSHGQDFPALTDFFLRSMRLESVDINSNAFLKAPFLEGLRGLPPTIQRLGIRDRENAWGAGTATPSLDDDTLVVLSSPGLCPALQHISFDHGFSISDAAVLRFITAKMLESQTLKHVDIQFNRNMTLDIMPGLQPFIETGLAVSLTYFPPSPSQSSPWLGLADSPNPPSWHPHPLPTHDHW